MGSWYELKANTSGTFRFRLKSGDGSTLLESGLYDDRETVERAIGEFRRHCGQEERYQKLIHSGGKNYFVLRGAEKEVLVTSHLYDSEAARREAISLIAEVGQTTLVKDAA
ncbi:YegP family protein [Pseudomonas paraeruginosa]|uniref:YegP family protein n=1 Tax=Pseudomonas paraeruginosa TaxID=2994495 RepID=UPI0039FCA516